MGLFAGKVRLMVVLLKSPPLMSSTALSAGPLWVVLAAWLTPLVSTMCRPPEAQLPPTMRSKLDHWTPVMLAEAAWMLPSGLVLKPAASVSTAASRTADLRSDHTRDDEPMAATPLC